MDLVHLLAAADAATPASAGSGGGGGKRNSKEAVSSVAQVPLLPPVDKAYTLGGVLDKAIVLFEHSTRNHHRSACPDTSQALSNAQGLGGVRGRRRGQEGVVWCAGW